jgi:hypothetical protein
LEFLKRGIFSWTLVIYYSPQNKLIFTKTFYRPRKPMSLSDDWNVHENRILETRIFSQKNPERKKFEFQTSQQDRFQIQFRKKSIRSPEYSGNINSGDQIWIWKLKILKFHKLKCLISTAWCSPTTWPKTRTKLG